jgi:type VI secretion system protein VasD
MLKQWMRFSGLLVVVTLFLVGCASSNGINAKMHISAAEYLNPSEVGEASPITLNFYELKSSAGFKQADYFELQANAASALNGDLVDKQSIEVRPGQHLDYKLFLPEGVKFIGVTAGYRNIDQSIWRSVIAVVEKKKKLPSWQSQKNITVHVNVQSQELHARLKK